MKRLLLVALVLLTEACSAKAAETSADVFISTSYATAQMLLRDGDIAGLDDALEPAMAPEVFTQLSPAKQHEIAQLYARGASASGHWSKAHDAYRWATHSPQATRDDWSSRLNTAILAGDGPDALATFKHEVDQNRPVLSGLGERSLYDLDSLITQSPNPTEARLALGRQMEREKLRPSAPYEDIDLLWLHYVQALLERGDLPAASGAAMNISNPMIMMAMQADQRFDALIARDPGRFDPRAAAERNLLDARHATARWPGAISYRVTEVQALAVLNRPTEALTLLDKLVSVPELRNSIDCWCVRAWRESVLISLGRGDEALAARERKTRSTGDNGVLFLDLAKTQLELDRPQEALKTLKVPMEGLGPRGEMVLARTAVCAAPTPTTEVEARLAFLREHQSAMPKAYISALLCMDRQSAAVDALVEQLRDPSTRLAALSGLQVYGVDPVRSRYAKRLDDRWDQLRANPRVRAEVEKVGRIKTYDLMQWQPVA